MMKMEPNGGGPQQEHQALERPLPYAPDQSHGRSLWPWFIALLILVAAVGAYFIYTHKGTNTAGGTGRSDARPAVVVVATARKADMNLYLNGLGSVAPFNTVTVRTRVDGQIEKIEFQEGQLIHEGDPLVEIDPRPFQVQLTQAQGQMAKDQAQLKNAELNVQRDQDAKDAISAQQLTTDQANADQAAGAVEIDQGAIDSAKLNLAYAHITAPITGRIGLRVVDVGNIVHASDQSGLAVITQLQPIAVLFTLPEDDLARVVKRMAGGNPLAVAAYDRDMTATIGTGTLSALDNQIDPGSGTVRLKAVFANDDGALYPNEFVNARLLVETLHDAITVPSAAVQRSPSSTFVYVVQNGDTVAMRNVTVGPSEADQTSITTGLSAGEVVVTDGVDKLQDGAKVSITRTPATSTSGDPNAEGGKPEAGQAGPHHGRHVQAAASAPSTGAGE